MAPSSNIVALLITCIISTCTCRYLESQQAFSDIIFTKEPHTNQTCYTEGESGSYMTSFRVFNVTTPFDLHLVALNAEPDGTGNWLYNGSTSFFYEEAKDREEQDARFQATLTNLSMNDIEYKLVIKSLTYLDETPPLYVIIMDPLSGEIRKASSVAAKFIISTFCPPMNTSIMTTDPTTPTTSPMRIDQPIPQNPITDSPITKGSINNFSTAMAKGRHLRPCGLLIGMLAGLCTTLIIFYKYMYM